MKKWTYILRKVEVSDLDKSELKPSVYSINLSILQKIVKASWLKYEETCKVSKYYKLVLEITRTHNQVK